MLYQVVEWGLVFLEVCISTIRQDAFNQIRVDIVCRNGRSICAEIRVGIDDSG